MELFKATNNDTNEEFLVSEFGVISDWFEINIEDISIYQFYADGFSIYLLLLKDNQNVTCVVDFELHEPFKTLTRCSNLEIETFNLTEGSITEISKHLKQFNRANDMSVGETIVKGLVIDQTDRLNLFNQFHFETLEGVDLKKVMKEKGKGGIRRKVYELALKKDGELVFKGHISSFYVLNQWTVSKLRELRKEDFDKDEDIILLRKKQISGKRKEWAIIIITISLITLILILM
jgi:hypothetical protein